jgi:tripartite-type tricarboxylate transporter receptor subunit TctC
MARVVASPDVREQFASQGAEAATGTPEEFRKAVHDELLETGKLVKLIGLKVDQ